MNHFIRQQYLEAIGIQSWQLKSAVDKDLPELINQDACYTESYSPPPIGHKSSEPEQIAAQQFKTEVPLQLQAEKEELSAPVPVPDSIPEPEVSTVNGNIEQMNYPLDSESHSDKKKSDLSMTIKPLPEVTSSQERTVLDTDLEQLIQDCRLCSKRQTRINPISGQGIDKASIFVISEPPTAEEDRAGSYLSGQASTLFKLMLHSIDKVDDYFFTGIIKCHSFSEYLVSNDEINHCATFLQSQIQKIQPKVLYVLGAKQAQSILKTKQSFNHLRGNVHSIVINNQPYSVIVSYPPAYLLRNPQYKREALKDLILMKSLLK